MKNKHIYTNIQEKHITLPDVKEPYVCYEVSITTEYTNIFGKHISKTETLPFLFGSLDVAKDYCEIMPKYKDVVISNGCIRRSYYDTYQLLNDKNESLGYIMWNNSFLTKDIKTYSTGYGTRSIHMKYLIGKPLIECFAYKICVCDTNDVETGSWCGWVKIRCEKLSELIRETLPIVNNTNNTWKFELTAIK